MAFHFGDGKWPGAAKVIEEMGELGQVLGKLLATDGATQHWDGTDLRERLIDETADLAAALAFFAAINGISTPDWRHRVGVKMAQFEAWHRDAGGK